jgi:hypothetical protein
VPLREAKKRNSEHEIRNLIAAASVAVIGREPKMADIQLILESPLFQFIFVDIYRLTGIITVFAPVPSIETSTDYGRTIPHYDHSTNAKGRNKLSPP